MSELSDEQKKFLSAQGIPDELLFNANGQSMSAIMKETMKQKGKVFAYNAVPCKEAGHTLRTRAGHCIQCDTSKIAYMLRHVKFGTVYIAGSVKGRLIKVGFTENTENKEGRIEQLKNSKAGYGGFDDWEMLFSAKCMNAGAVESSIQALLRKYEIPYTYKHDNHLQTTSELFKCSYQTAKKALSEVQERDGVQFIDTLERKLILQNYDFQNLIQK